MSRRSMGIIDLCVVQRNERPLDHGDDPQGGFIKLSGSVTEGSKSVEASASGWRLVHTTEEILKSE